MVDVDNVDANGCFSERDLLKLWVFHLCWFTNRYWKLTSWLTMFDMFDLSLVGHRCPSMHINRHQPWDLRKSQYWVLISHMLAYVTIKFLRVLKISQILPDFSRFFKISKVSFLKFLKYPSFSHGKSAHRRWRHSDSGCGWSSVSGAWTGFGWGKPGRDHTESLPVGKWSRD